MATKTAGRLLSTNLTTSIWLNITMFFGWRACDEHHSAKLGDFEVKFEDGPQKMK